MGLLLASASLGAQESPPASFCLRGLDGSRRKTYAIAAVLALIAYPFLIPDT